ncbi:MAG TPA: hypothetical protein VHU81_12360, partial [Thermoanaerobaculia bacterium]|nr:hypothetical protein [Thermoanaerobaculia bacterium]
CIKRVDSRSPVKVDLQLASLSQQPASSSRVLVRGVLQQNKLARHPGSVVLMRNSGVLHQDNGALLWEGLF